MSVRPRHGLRQAAAVAAAVVVLVLGAAGATAQVPHDGRQTEQWAVADGTVLNLPAAWQLSQGAGVVVAVIDSGARLDHPDLAPNIWVNFGEVPGNGVDDDANGYVDDVHGIDLTTSARDRQDLSDANGHGTHVAGIIGGAADGRGIVGVAFRARLMIVKVLDARGSGTTGAVAEGIRYAAANGARIINLSLGGPTNDPRVAQAVRAAEDANVLVVCSAGNLGQDVDQTPSYPVSIAAPNLIGVAATEPARGRTLGEFSNYGRNTISLAAPGVDVLSSANSGGWELKSGTSMAAPHAAGVAALMAAMRADLTASELRAQLIQNAGRSSLPVGGGYLDALSSVLSVASAPTYRLGQPPLVRILEAQREGGQTVAQVAALGSLDAIARFRIGIDGRRVAELRPRGSPFTVRLRGRPGRKLKVEALDASGGVVAAATRTVRGVKLGKRGVRRGSGVGTTAQAPPATIRISGAFTATALTADLAYFYRRDVRSPPRFDLVGGRTVTGIADVARGISDIGLASRPLEPDDPPGLVFTPFARTGICLVTNRANPVPGLTRGQVQDLVAARITEWGQVPGSTLTGPIVAGALTLGGGSRTAFEAAFLDADAPQLYVPRTLVTAAQMRDFIRATPNAWGYVDLAFAGTLHAVPYEGIPCTRAAVASGAYPARTDLGFVTRGAPKGRVGRFIRWVRRSARARRVIATRYVVF